MKKYFAYTRVSTLKQGEKGVSLQEQQAAISAYSRKHDLQISEWFEERVTAAKQGRPVFSRMMTRLQRGQADGIVIHKIDRSARNLRDWADLGDLIDAGIAVHFANESLDLLSRGGRLAADIQAVVASDYVRNLREETLKGLHGRLKQGIYPFNAPIGYLNCGGGQLKAIDSARAPLIRQAFELYAGGGYTLDTLLSELHRRGLRNRHGGDTSLSRLSKLLRDPFYTGIIRIKRTGAVYAGKHEPLVSVALFEAVQDRLHGRLRSTKWAHDFLFRGMFKCHPCNRFLVGELQKHRVYYRCHTKGCATRCVREDLLEKSIISQWPSVAPTNEWKERLRTRVEACLDRQTEDTSSGAAHRQARMALIDGRLSRLVDALIDGLLDKDSFDRRKLKLLQEKQSLEAAHAEAGPSTGELSAFIMNALELACSAQQSYEIASPSRKRELVETLSSNRRVAGKQLLVEPRMPVRVLLERASVSQCGHYRDATRTLDNAVYELIAWAKGELKHRT